MFCTFIIMLAIGMADFHGVSERSLNLVSGGHLLLGDSL